MEARHEGRLGSVACSLYVCIYRDVYTFVFQRTVDIVRRTTH